MVILTSGRASRCSRSSILNSLLLSSTSQTIYTCNNLASSWRRAERSWLVGVDQRKRFRLGENFFLRSSLHKYINNQHPIVKHDNCIFRRRPHTPASCVTFVWVEPWTSNEKIGSKWVQTWMFGRQTFEFCAWGLQSIEDSCESNFNPGELWAALIHRTLFTWISRWPGNFVPVSHTV